MYQRHVHSGEAVSSLKAPAYNFISNYISNPLRMGKSLTVTAQDVKPIQ